MIKSIDFKDYRLVRELYDLQKAAYLVEAKLIHFYDIPPLKETIDELSESNETFLGYFEEKELAGAISYTIDGHELTICRMMVHPDHVRKGIAKKLLHTLEERNRDIAIFKVSTGKENLPARALYQKNGFHHFEDIEIVPGFFISCFLKKAKLTKNIRILNETDAQLYQELRLRALKIDPEAFGSTYEREVKFTLETLVERLKPTDNKFSLGAFDDRNLLVGMVTFMRESSPKTAHKGNIFGMFVEPEMRGQGLGKSLLLELINKVKSCNGLEQINLAVVSNNELAKTLYKSIGFQVYGVEKNALKWNGEYFDEELMVLRL
jgi:ribosomal protein S18 acetylase RimI-like enzyme